MAAVPRQALLEGEDVLAPSGMVRAPLGPPGLKEGDPGALFTGFSLLTEGRG